LNHSAVDLVGDIVYQLGVVSLREDLVASDNILEGAGVLLANLPFLFLRAKHDAESFPSTIPYLVDKHRERCYSERKTNIWFIGEAVCKSRWSGWKEGKKSEGRRGSLPSAGLDRRKTKTRF
jgi:hypothetical protein